MIMQNNSQVVIARSESPSDAAICFHPSTLINCHCEERVPERRGNLGLTMNKTFYVYILTNRTHRVLYTGVTNNLARRVEQHRQGVAGSFTAKYKVTKLVHAEVFGDIRDAIAREKQIKAGSRQDKINLINEENPEWEDLGEYL
jgi:putative endonuclease